MSVASGIIILTQYYPPETGAPQNRLHSLAKFLASNEFQVTVFTAMPNYPTNRVYTDYRGKWVSEEVIDEVRVYRSWIFVSNSRSMLARLANYFSFVVTSFFRLLFKPKATYLLCESPPLFLGITAVLLSKLKGMKLIFNVSDLWPESAEKLGLVKNRTVLKLAYGLERWIYGSSWLITGQTQGIVASIRTRMPGKKVVWLPNGIDLESLKQTTSGDWLKQWKTSPVDFVVLYAGVLGHAQGLEVLLQAALQLRDEKVKFVIAGDGPEKQKLQQMAADLSLTSVVFQGHVPKSDMPGMIGSCSAFVVPLRKLELFKGAIPSKLFEPLALGKPILLGVDGEARQLFIEDGNSGVSFEPENAEDLAVKIKWLMNNRAEAEQLGQRGREYVNHRFNRSSIHQAFLAHLAPFE